MSIRSEVIDLRVQSNKYKINNQLSLKTGRILVIDGGWSACGLSSEIIASVVENIQLIL